MTDPRERFQVIEGGKTDEQASPETILERLTATRTMLKEVRERITSGSRIFSPHDLTDAVDYTFHRIDEIQLQEHLDGLIPGSSELVGNAKRIIMNQALWGLPNGDYIGMKAFLAIEGYSSTQKAAEFLKNNASDVKIWLDLGGRLSLLASSLPSSGDPIQRPPHAWLTS